MRIRRVLGAAVVASAVVVMAAGPGAVATHEPANKVSAAGSATEVVSPGESVILLQDRVKTSKPTDLILGVTSECAITTEVTTVGNDLQNAEGIVRMWVEIDGKVVPVSSDDPAATRGRVVFCNRFYERQTSLFDDEDATIRTFERSREASAFNWMALDVGSGIHTITVKADLQTFTSSAQSTALAAVGKRTLIIEPVKAANDETVTALG